jgi:hypothetical protein
MKHLSVSAIVCIVIILGGAQLASAQAIQLLPPVGGRGGTPFQGLCPSGQHLLGFNLRAGHLVDSIQPICGVPVTTSLAEARGTMPQFGGAGGQPVRLICPEGAPIVLGVAILAEGRDTQIVNSIHVYCGILAGHQERPGYPHARYDSPAQGGGALFGRFPVVFCPPGLLAVGVHGRSGAMVDQLGLICGPPQSPSASTAGRTLGKRKLPADDTAGRTLGKRKLPQPAGEATLERRGATSQAAEAVERMYEWFDEFVGRYQLSSGHVITITRESNRFMAEFADGASGVDPGKHEIFLVERERPGVFGRLQRRPGQPIGSDLPPPTFSSANATFTIEFGRGISGRVETLTLIAAGGRQRGVRLN